MPTPINISASRGASILGISNWKTQVETWLEIKEARDPGFCEKNGYELPVFQDNPQLRWGKAFEDSIVELAESKAGIKINAREKLFAYKITNLMSSNDIAQLNPMITCHIDGWYGVKKNEPLHEGKTTSAYYFRENFGEPGTDKVPVEYQVQCQHQMACTGAKEVILSVLVFPNRVDDWEEMGWIPEEGSYWTLERYENDNYMKSIDSIEISDWAKTLNEMGYFHQYHIKRNDDVIDKMISKYTEFWERYIIRNEIPEISGMNDIKKLFREPIGTVVATEQIERWNSEEKMLNDEIKELKKRADQLKSLQLEYLMECSKADNYEIDDDSQEKIVLRGIDGRKLHSYGKDKSGKLVFR